MEDTKEKKKVTIIINTRPQEWDKKEKISFDEVVALAYDNSNDPSLRFTVDYSRGEEPHKEGSLTAGQEVKVKERMVFNVYRTNKS